MTGVNSDGDGPLQHRQRYRLGRRGKRALKRSEILFREVEFECGVVFPHMCNVGRLRNDHNAVLPE